LIPCLLGWRGREDHVLNTSRLRHGIFLLPGAKYKRDNQGSLR